MELTSTFGLDPAIEARFRSIGPVFSPDIVPFTREIFAPTRNLAIPHGGNRSDDIAYGNHPRQKLDIVTPAANGSAPTILFVPGGGLTGGDKSIYAHIPASFARLGFVGVAMNYRLAPEFLYPSGAQDVCDAIDWIHRNILDFGGDPETIFVFGQSAGAIHAASTLLDKRFNPQAISKVRCALLMSGIYEVAPDHEVSNLNLYFGNDAESLKDRSVCYHACTSTTPVITAVAELEPPYFGLSASALVAELTVRDGRPSETIWLRGHNHLSPVLNLGAKNDLLGVAIAERFRAFMT